MMRDIFRGISLRIRGQEESFADDRDDLPENKEEKPKEKTIDFKRPVLKQTSKISRKKAKTSKDGIYRQEVYRLLRKTKNPLAAFVARPKNINFETQVDGEEIILLLRKHWITNVVWIFFAVLMLFAPAVLLDFPIISFLPARFQFISILMWYLLTIIFVLEKFLSWYFNVYIITDERVIDVDFYNLIYKEISDAEIEKIEDVTTVMGGVVQTLFNFGTILIQTAAEKTEFDFEAVPNPALVVKVLQQLRMEEKQEVIDGRIR